MKFKTIALALFSILMLAAMLVQPGNAQDSTPTPVYSISVSPTSAAKTGQPGSTVLYSIDIKNTGNQVLNLSVESSGISGWVVEIPTGDEFSLPVNDDTTTVKVKITIPTSVPAGSTEVTTVRFLNNGVELGKISLITSAGSNRPIIALDSYNVGANGAVSPGQKFDLHMRVANHGQGFGRNIIFTFSSTDFLPVDTGGVITLNEMDPGEAIDIVQPMIASSALFGQKVATTAVTVNYTDFNQQAYTENFTITINLSQPSYSGVSKPTATPTPVSRPQLVVSAYSSDVDPLQPSSVFTLNLDIRNLGTSDARSTTMVLGGGVTSGDASGTPSPGISGSGADTSIFAPLGSSNLVYLGDVLLGATVQTSQKLIVNTSANPGAYAFKISFVYDDAKGVRQINDQVITLLIYQLPQLEINYYRDPGVFMLGQPNMLPLQVTNLGRKQAVLGNMKVTSPNAEVSNNVILVGMLDPGGYYTLDASVTPLQPGPLELTVEVNYTDDFNQPRTVSQTLVIEVMDMPTPEPFPPGGYPPEGELIPPVEETTWQKILRFIKGLLGLSSGAPTTTPDQIFPGASTPQIEPGPVIVGPKG